MQAPLCFASPVMLDLWFKADNGTGGSKCANPCRDCQPGYQVRMKRAGRCAHPETQFSVDADGGVYGYWPQEPA